MIYVLTSPEHAEQLSRSIMRLLRPSHLRNDDWTDLYCGVVQHPTNGQAALELPESEQVFIHPEADGAELAALLEVFVADGALTQFEANKIIITVQENAGKMVRIIDFIPSSWNEWTLSYEQMVNNGWFTEPEDV